MFNESKSISLKNSEGVTVLSAAIKINLEASERCEMFYRNIAEAFIGEVHGEFFAEAQAKYQSCDDRRKRYRYVPDKASLFVIRKDEREVLFRFVSPGGDVLSERHMWDGDILTKRITDEAQK